MSQQMANSGPLEFILLEEHFSSELVYIYFSRLSEVISV